MPNGTFLTHWTRECPGPWPDESEESYLDDLIFDADRVNRSAEAALQRIVRKQRIVATTRAIRGDTPMVSFTAVPLARLPELRVFRPHRGRWDFELYGICIRQSWIQARGGRPVCYGDEEDWDALPESERPYFQLRESGGARGRPVIDWTLEREWRLRGDVCLADLDAQDAVLFVPSQGEAERLATISRWPVVVLTPTG
jgi:hypothetical protein